MILRIGDAASFRGERFGTLRAEGTDADWRLGIAQPFAGSAPGDRFTPRTEATDSDPWRDTAPPGEGRAFKRVAE
ncbi:hypothetical protein [Streptomyces sp. NPDC005303]|uniref:hypothetical protein n=1 Tax=Streptomyces sp. NPDC005303 TaxID=3155713 RepID=UPI0033A1F9A2